MSDALRILQVITRGDEAGGAQTHLRELSVVLAARGHEVEVAMGTWGVLADQLTAAGIRCHHVPTLVRNIDPIRDPLAIRDLARLMRATNPHVVALHSSKAGMTGRVAAKVAGVPAIFTAHGWAFNSGLGRARGIYRWIERGCAPLSSRIICVSAHDRQIAIKAGISPKRLIAIPNGIPDHAPTTSSRVSDGPLRMIAVARFAPPKDPTTLLQAIARAPGVCLDFVGNGPTLADARATAIQLGVSDRVRFLGRRDDVQELLAKSDAFVLSSRSEGFPISTLEAMRAGLPVVVTNVGGAAETVIDGVTGFVVPPVDPAAMAQAFLQLAENASLRKQMGASGYRHFRANFRSSQMADSTEAVYHQVAKRQPHRQVGTFVAGISDRPGVRIEMGNCPDRKAPLHAAGLVVGKGMHRGD